jgi:hypothetical protein
VTSANTASDGVITTDDTLDATASLDRLRLFVAWLQTGVKHVAST